MLESSGGPMGGRGPGPVFGTFHTYLGDTSLFLVGPRTFQHSIYLYILTVMDKIYPKITLVLTFHFEKVSKLRSKVDKKVTTFRKNIRPGRFDPYT